MFWSSYLISIRKFKIEYLCLTQIWLLINMIVFFTDWFDGLQTFMRYICHRSWLGGWLMPQKKSYFALQLPKRWWVFGLDLALHGDIDVYQFKFFSELITEKVNILPVYLLSFHFYEMKYSTNACTALFVHLFIIIIFYFYSFFCCHWFHIK